MEYDRDDSKTDEAWKADAEGRGGARSERKDEAKAAGRAAEELASGGKLGQQAAATAEQPDESGVSLYRSSEDAQDGKQKGRARRYGPLAALLLTVTLAGGIFSVAQIATPFAFTENVREEFNTLQTSMNLSSNNMMKSMLRSDRNKSVTRGKVFSDEQYFKISESMETRLKNNGIEHVNVDGIEGLAYKNKNTGEWSIVLANDADIGKVSSGTMSIGGEDVTISSKTTLDTKFKTDTDFANDFDVSTRTWKGQVAGWFTQLSENFHKWIGNTRNKFADMGDEVDREEVVDAVHRNGVAEEIGTSKGSPREEIEAGDDDGPRIGDDGIDANADAGKLKESLTARAKKVMAMGGQAGCMLTKVAGAIDATVTALHTIKILNFTTAVLEAFDRAKIGEGAGAMTTIMKELSTPGDTYAMVDGSWQQVKSGTSTLESQPWSQIFAGAPVTGNDPVVKTYSSGNAFSMAMSKYGEFGDATAFLGEVGGSGNAAKTCLALDTAGDAQEIMEKVGALLAFGPLGFFLDMLLGAIINLTLQNIVAKAIEAIVPMLAETVSVDIISNMAGEMAGYALLSGVNIYLGRRHIATSGRIGTKSQILAQWKETQEVIAREAEVDRYMRSPLDITSKNTFLGSIVYATLPTYFAANTPVKAAASIAGTAMSSLKAILPVAGAASDEINFKEELRTDCTNLKELTVGGEPAVGDAYCQAKAYQDNSASNLTPLEVYQKIQDNFDEDDSEGNPKINPNSDYAKWLVACSARSAGWGYASGQVGSFVTGANTSKASDLQKAMQTGLEGLSIGQLALDVYEFSNIDWETGQQCLTGENVTYYGQYGIHQELLETAGVIKKASNTAFLEQYFEEHPLDNSYEGMIARYSGLTKDQVEEVLGIIEYADYVANYDAEGLLPLDNEQEEKPLIVEGESRMAILPEIVLAERVIYTDLREEKITA